MNNITPVILCGGSGTRLWPLSRAGFPKQFLVLSGTNSLFQQAIERVNTIAAEDIAIGETLVVTNEEHRFLALDQLRELKSVSATLLLEPVRRNVAPALTLAALQATANGDDPILVVTPADQTVIDASAFTAALQQSVRAAASGAIVILGVTPDSAETGCGYIKRQGEPGQHGEYTVDQSAEKPSIATAQTYLENGEYAWNSGMFVLKAGTWLKALQQFRPDIAAATRLVWSEKTADAPFVRPSKAAFAAIPGDSIDYAVMEPISHPSHVGEGEVGFEIRMVPLAAGWNDLGDWDAVWQRRQDANGNVTQRHPDDRHHKHPDSRNQPPCGHRWCQQPDHTAAPTSTNTVWQHATATQPRSDAQRVLNKSRLTPFPHKHILMNTSITSQIPTAFVQLIWDVFFATKSRGQSIEAHFPWLARVDSSAWYVVLQDNQQVIGGLCVKEVSNSANRSNCKVASIGLVCIAPEYRGKGYARSILEAAIAEAKVCGYDALTLWTQKWDVYAPHGFKSLDDAVFGSVELPDASVKRGGSLEVQVSRQEFPAYLGMPLFALSGSIFETANAQVVLIEDKAGPILADWSGSDAEVALILEMMPVKKWRINAHQGDNLLDVLEMRGAKLNMSPSNLQMWLPLKKELANINWSKLFRFSVLDRI